MARGSVALTRLSKNAEGNYTYELKHPWGDKTHVLLSPTELMEKLCALVPPPNAHLTRFSGVLAPAAKWRQYVIADYVNKVIEKALGSTTTPKTKRELTPAERYDWATLLKRIYAIDMTVCEKCGGPLSLRAKILDSREAEQILTAMGLPARPPPVTPARVIEMFPIDE